MPLSIQSNTETCRGCQCNSLRARAALTRLSSLVQEAGVPPQPELIAETVDLIAFIVRKPEGRRLKELVRVEGYNAAEGFRLSPLEME